MSWTYCCPECKARLDPDKSVILIAEHEDTRVLVGFHPQPGNYEVKVPSNVKIEDGTIWEFTCPMCLTNLATEGSSNLCELELLRAGQRHRLLFSNIAGKQATFILSGETIDESHGKDIDKFDDAPVGQLKYIRY